ncbi:MAG: hypothetical protein ACYCX6_01810 [Vulcanimicrobiaceae bacterium]
MPDRDLAPPPRSFQAHATCDRAVRGTHATTPGCVDAGRRSQLPVFPIKSETSVSDLEKKDREKIRRLLKDRAIAAYEAKEQEVTPEIMRLVEQRYLLLPIIDRMWVDHLAIMDHLKTGIGLRGYGQIDPRVEYEKEAYEIFEDLKTNIADEAGLDSVMPFRNASARWSPLNLRQNSHNVAMRWGGASERRHPLVAWI